MTRKKTRRRAGATGNALVEASLTLVVFLTILFSLFDFGFDLWEYQTVVARARAAVRYGAVYPSDTTGMKNMVLYNSTSSGSNPLFGLSTSNITVTRSDSGTLNDRLTLSVASFGFTKLTLKWAGYTTGNTVTVSTPVEPD